MPLQTLSPNRFVTTKHPVSFLDPFFVTNFPMKKITFLTLAVSSILIAGCGGSETVIPKGPLTEEQKAAIKAEDKAVADEESGKSR